MRDLGEGWLGECVTQSASVAVTIANAVIIATTSCFGLLHGRSP